MRIDLEAALSHLLAHYFDRNQMPFSLGRRSVFVFSWLLVKFLLHYWDLKSITAIDIWVTWVRPSTQILKKSSFQGLGLPMTAVGVRRSMR